MSGSVENSSVAGADSDDDFDWEEVVVPQADQQPEASSSSGPNVDLQEGPSNSERQNIEITIQTQRRSKKGSPTKKNPRAEQLYAERLARLMCHQIHTVALLANARIRNKWLNDPLLHARLMSLTPLHLQNAFAAITRARIPEAAQRGRMFESAVARLAEWWSHNFRVELTGHIKSRTFDEVQKLISVDVKGKGKARARDDGSDGEEEGEVIKSEKSLMKHALMMRGSRDTSAQLFTALCRALGIPARLVVSLQSVPWQASVGKPKPPAKKKKGKEAATGKAPAPGDEDEDDDKDMEEVKIPGSPSAASPSNKVKGKGKANDDVVFSGVGQRLDGNTPASPAGTEKGKQKAPPVIKLRKQRGRKLGSGPAEQPKRRERTPDPTSTPPVFWTEVFSRADARWLPVDPIRCIISKRKAFDPTPNPNASVKPDRTRPLKIENRMVYVIAFEEDNYARDVTPRYARAFGAKVSKMQQGGKGRKEWWEKIVGLVQRPYRLHRDDLEDDELQTNQLTEGMPTSMAGFKDHPLYVLERHLKRDQVIHPLVELGKFRGEPVYPRSHVIALKTAENWMRQGRQVREGAQPMKWVKQRAMTVNKQRAIEMAMADRKDRPLPEQEAEGEGFASEDGVMQGLYAESQTELYRPPPVVDGKIPKNDFGNIDLYVPTMLPAGAAHIPYKGTAKIARQLGFDYAEAVTSFEFKKRKAFPVITGIVIAAENEETLLEAYWEAEHDAEEKRQAKRQEQVIKRWTKLIHGLRIRQRLQEQYADADQRENLPVGPDEEEVQEQGGFLTGANDVVQPYTLPKNFHDMPNTSVVVSLPLSKKLGGGSSDVDTMEDVAFTNSINKQELGNDSDDDDMEEIVPVPPLDRGSPQPPRVPKSMLELAEEAARQEEGQIHNESDQNPFVRTPEPSNNGASTSTTRTRARATHDAERPPVQSSSARPKATSRSDSRRTRKRAREDAESSDAGTLAANAASNRSSPTKRPKKAPPVPASTRVLRTRTPKSASKLQEEEEMEEAYRRAAAE